MRFVLLLAALMNWLDEVYRGIAVTPFWLAGVASDELTLILLEDLVMATILTATLTGLLIAVSGAKAMKGRAKCV